jgi:branched-chain amino acid transport system ATP-binding protein
MLEVGELSLHYARHVALNRVSLKVGRGETVVILGANGAGKSSLLKAIAGMAKPTMGLRSHSAAGRLSACRHTRWWSAESPWFPRAGVSSGI